MFFSVENVLPIGRTQPASGIGLRKGKLIWHLDFLKCVIAQKLMVAHPGSVRVQSNPGAGEHCKCPARFSQFAGRLQIETVKGQFPCPKQSPHFQGEKRGDRSPTQRHQKWDQRVNTANSQETSQKYQCADDFFRPR